MVSEPAFSPLPRAVSQGLPPDGDAVPAEDARDRVYLPDPRNQVGALKDTIAAQVRGLKNPVSTLSSIGKNAARVVIFSALFPTVWCAWRCARLCEGVFVRPQTERLPFRVVSPTQFLTRWGAKDKLPV